jgi:endonuclease YncB( thermonuclease family)
MWGWTVHTTAIYYADLHTGEPQNSASLYEQGLFAPPRFLPGEPSNSSAERDLIDWSRKSSIRMVRKPTYRSNPDEPVRPRFDRRVGLVILLAVIVGVVAFVPGPLRFSDQQVSVSNSSEIIVHDGDTVQSGGVTYRLMGFDTPERGDRALCDKERDLGEKAFAWLRALLASGEPTLRRAACACASGTEGSQVCNAGRACAYLAIDGTDVGDVLTREGFARPFACSVTGCPPRRTWC